MERIELQLKNLIIQEYGNISTFLKIIGMPRSTFDSIMQRGIKKASISNVFKICQELGITADGLANDEIEFRDKIETLAAHHDGDEYSPEELEEIEQFKAFVKAKRD